MKKLRKMPTKPSSPNGKYLDDLGRTDAERYLTDIYDGKILACTTMKQLADMMLPRFHEPYRQFHFDAEKSFKPVRFMERICVIPEGERQGELFTLEQFQRAAIELSFGFVDDDGYRQFRQTLMMLGRKNGKSVLLSGLMLYFLCGDGEPGAEVICVANSERQSRRIFGHAEFMARRSPQLAKRIRKGAAAKTGATALNYDKNGSILVSIPSNTGSADGYSASAYVYDELAATTDMGAMLSQIEESVAARRQASGWIISSENYTRHNIWDEKIDHCKAVLSGKVDDDRILPILYTSEGHDPFDQASWFLSNPGLQSGIKSMTYMENRAHAAQTQPTVKSSFLTKDLCIRATSYTSYLSQEECHNPETFEFNPETDRYGVLGFDLSSVGDLTCAVCAFMRPGDDRIYEISHAWIPEAQVEINSAADLKERDGVPYSLWASGDDPWMTIQQGDKVDTHMAILGFIDEMTARGIYIRYCCYDPWHVDDYLLRQLHMRLGKDNCSPCPYSAKSLSPLMQEHRIDLRAHRIINPSPVAEWCRSNVQSKTDAAGNDFPNKKELKPQHRIDMYMAELYAMKAMRDNMDSYKNIIGWYPPGEADPDQA